MIILIQIMKRFAENCVTISRQMHEPRGRVNLKNYINEKHIIC